MEYTDEMMEKQESTQDLFAAYREGKNIDELNDMLMNKADDDSSHEGVGDEDGGTLEASCENAVGVTTPQLRQTETDTLTQGNLDEEQQAEESAKGELQQEPYRVYQTHEDFQKDFDYHWNKRHREAKEQQEKQMREHQEQLRRMDDVQNLLAEVLGVSKENAIAELTRRRYAIEAEKEGVDNTEQYAEMKIAQEEVKRLREKEQERDAQMVANENARRAIEDIRRQGVELADEVAGFNLDEAMQNEDFRQTAFALYRAGDTQAVAKAHRAVFFYAENKAKNEEMPTKHVQVRPNQVRPKENGALRGVSGQVKPIDFSRMSSKEILEMERRVLSGDKIM